jgi:hypothetical protein
MHAELEQKRKEVFTILEREVEGYADVAWGAHFTGYHVYHELKSVTIEELSQIISEIYPDFVEIAVAAYKIGSIVDKIDKAAEDLLTTRSTVDMSLETLHQHVLDLLETHVLQVAQIAFVQPAQIEMFFERAVQAIEGPMHVDDPYYQSVLLKSISEPYHDNYQEQYRLLESWGVWWPENEDDSNDLETPQLKPVKDLG